MPASIAAQLYTVRDHTKTIDDIARTCQRVRAMGYEAVEAAALGPHDVAALARILGDNGLVCVCSHADLDDMVQESARCADYHAALGCAFASIGGFGFGGHPTDQWRKFIDEYNVAAATMQEAGIRIGYHNHYQEWIRNVDGVRPIDLLIRDLHPAVWIELDTYWVAHAGGEPTDWIRRIADSGSPDLPRLPCVHFKDMQMDGEGTRIMCEVGSGNLHWPGILDACRAAGTQWHIVERDHGALDPFESLKVSLEQLQAMGLE